MSLQDIFSKVDKSGEGVCVQASTLGSLEALLSFLDSGGHKLEGFGATGVMCVSVHLCVVLRC